MGGELLQFDKEHLLKSHSYHHNLIVKTIRFPQAPVHTRQGWLLSPILVNIAMEGLVPHILAKCININFELGDNQVENDSSLKFDLHKGRASEFIFSQILSLYMFYVYSC